ncbi:MAG: hypothetical protein WBA68_02550 [Alteraurantiacibacter sp.]
MAKTTSKTEGKRTRKPKVQAETGAAASTDTAASAPAPAGDPPAGDEGPKPGSADGASIIQVRSKRPLGRRRAGIGFTPEPTPVDLSQLSPRQIDALATDPELIIDPPIE